MSLAFRDWRTGAALALGGAVGVGIGGGVVDLLKQPFVSPGAQGVTFWWASGFMVIQGAIFVFCVLLFRRGIIGELAQLLRTKL